MIRILFAEDLPADAEMARREIQNEGIEFDYRLVDAEEEFRYELVHFNPDIVISDYSMPPFDGLKALEITRELKPSIPFIILTGSLNEETAVYCMKAGANDYVLKEKIKRLPFALREAIEKSHIEHEKETYQDQLKKTLNDYTDLINGMNETIWILNSDGKVLDVNNTAVEKLGYSRQELTEIGLSGVDNQFSEAEIHRMVASMKKDKVQFFYTQHITKQGEVIPVEVNSSLIHYQGDNAILCVVRDISERLRTEGRLRLLSRSVEQSPTSIIITNKGGEIQYVNPAFSQYTGFGSSEVLGYTPRVLKSGKHSKEFYENLWKTILSGKEWAGEIINRRKNGDLFWEYTSISPIVNDKNEITHFVSVKEDVTEKRKMIEDLKVAKEKAEESDRLKSAFLANMSHEIRTPMNGILGFTDMLKEDETSVEEREQYIQIIHKSGKRLMNTVNDLVEISRIEANVVTIDYHCYDINKMINDLVLFFRHEAGLKDLEVMIGKLLPEDQKELIVDYNKIESILSNLIKNAVKYTEQGYIRVDCELKNDELHFQVKDTGTGIPKHRQEAVFNRFEQADISDTRAFEGSGLGLAISKSYVEMMGGDIRLESEEGEGSVFYFMVPLKKH